MLTALGSTLSNKYAEGYPGRRYYGGCSEVDKAELLGHRAVQGACSAPTTPTCSRTRGPAPTRPSTARSSSPARQILAMSLPHGGHLTHGTKVSFSGKWFNAVHYGVDKDTEDIDYDQVEQLAREHRPKVILCRRLGHPAADRLRALPGDRRRGRRDLHGRRRALHRPRRRQGDPQPGARSPTSSRSPRTRCCAVRAAGALVCKAEHATALDKAVFPMMQGGPQMHAVAAKAVNFKECATPEYQAYARQVVANARRWPRALGEKGIRPITGGTDTHLSLLDLQPVRVTGGRRGALRRGRHHPEQERDPVRPAAAERSRRASGSARRAVTTQGMGEERDDARSRASSRAPSSTATPTPSTRCPARCAVR